MRWKLLFSHCLVLGAQFPGCFSFHLQKTYDIKVSAADYAGRPWGAVSPAVPCQRWRKACSAPLLCQALSVWAHRTTPEAKRADICQQGQQLKCWQKVARLRSFPWLVYEGCLNPGLSCLILSPLRQVSPSEAGSATCSKHLGLPWEQTGLTYTGKSYSN